MYRVVKNTLMARALEGLPFADAVKCLKGTPTGVVMGLEDPVTPAKLTYEFLKECDHLKVKGGVVDNRAIGAQEAEALSKMPSREELQGMIVGQAMSPGRNVAGQLKSQAGRILGAIEAFIEKQEA
ncbi:MAG: 50S ribosomal protein L10 [Cytophagaceae bacterium]|nr:MAG: 50S ribosomal protein L10 [Cytophagaceae bacterium]